MKWDRRLNSTFPSTDLPADYLKLVESTLTNAMEKGLAHLKTLYPDARFKSYGAIYGDEVLLAITLSLGTGNLAATTVYASVDYLPNIPEPGLENTLSAALDAVGGVFELYLDPEDHEKIEQLADSSLSALEDAPFDWTQVKAPEAKVGVWVKMDKSNPELDLLTEEWLSKNDPEYKKKGSLTEDVEAEEFFEERLDAIKTVNSGGGSGQNGPIKH